MREESERVEPGAPDPEPGNVTEPAERVQTRLERLDLRVRRLVQERPLAAASVALVFGYALGRLMARR